MLIVMYEETIESVLRFCKRNISFFLISKTFERIYSGIIYTPEVCDKLFKIACYENDKLIIEMLEERDFIKDSDNYWNCNNRNELLMDWKKYKVYDLIWELYNVDVPIYYEEDKVPQEYSRFGYELLIYLHLLKDKFIKNRDHWTYKFYEIICHDNCHGRFILFLDHKFNNFLMFEIGITVVKIMCNKFDYDIVRTLRPKLSIKEDNLSNLFDFIIILYQIHVIKWSM